MEIKHRFTRNMSLSRPPAVPIRSSSKRALERDIEHDLSKKHRLHKDIRVSRKRIKAKGSFDATYRAGHREVAGLELERHQLVRSISMKQFLIQGGCKGINNKWQSRSSVSMMTETTGMVAGFLMSMTPQSMCLAQAITRIYLNLSLSPSDYTFLRQLIAAFIYIPYNLQLAFSSKAAL